jgi:rhomboid-like protein
VRPALFTLLVISGSLYYAYTWTPPLPSERIFPTVPIAFSTVASLIAINAGVFLLWKTPLPPVWRILNRYFISVPAIPHAASMLGAAFSHQSLTHLGMNMAVLYVFGTSLCEQIGAGPFLGLYMSGAVASSFASLAYNVVRQRFGVVSLGASGAIAALIGAYAVFNPDAQLYVIFLPFLMLRAKTFVACLAAMETLGIVRGWRVLDHVAHLSGLGWGVLGGYVVEAEYRRRLERKRREEEEKRWLGWW